MIYAVQEMLIIDILLELSSIKTKVSSKWLWARFQLKFITKNQKMSDQY